MKKFASATSSQIEQIKQWGLLYDDSWERCRDIIEYVRHGNGNGSASLTEHERLSLLRNIQQEWMGKTVLFRGRQVYVRYVGPRRTIEEQFLEKPQEFSSFFAQICWERPSVKIEGSKCRRKENSYLIDIAKLSKELASSP